MGDCEIPHGSRVPHPPFITGSSSIYTEQLLFCHRLPLPVKAECLTDHCLPAQAYACQNGRAADPFFSPADISGNTIRLALFNI